jgi:large subunit ribosomal protein L25
MDVVVHALQVRGPANKIPEQIEIDVTHLGVNDNLTAGEVKLPEGLTLDVDAHTTLIAIAAPRTEAAPAEAATEAAAPAAAESGS